jgi:bifunctional DNA-binding transcriptional regulator/antitoxin component of YhaV-PrlF toxin-antitoxin module
VVSAQVPPRTHERGIPATSDVSVVKCALPRRVRSSRPEWSRDAGGSVVSAVVIAPVVPPAGSQGRDGVVGEAPGGGVPQSRRRLPLPRLIVQRSTVYVYGLAALDDRGRLADRTIMRALGWSAGLRLDIRDAVGLLVVHARADGEFRVTGQGHLRLPVLIRRRCGLEPGDRVLLAADPPQRRLVIYPPAVLDEFTAQRHHRVGLVGGESV